MASLAGIKAAQVPCSTGVARSIPRGRQKEGPRQLAGAQDSWLQARQSVAFVCFEMNMGSRAWDEEPGRGRQRDSPPGAATLLTQHGLAWMGSGTRKGRPCTSAGGHIDGWLGPRSLTCPVSRARSRSGRGVAALEGARGDGGARLMMTAWAWGPRTFDSLSRAWRGAVGNDSERGSGRCSERWMCLGRLGAVIDLTVVSLAGDCLCLACWAEKRLPTRGTAESADL